MRPCSSNAIATGSITIGSEATSSTRKPFGTRLVCSDWEAGKGAVASRPRTNNELMATPSWAEVGDQIGVAFAGPCFDSRHFPFDVVAGIGDCLVGCERVTGEFRRRLAPV